MSDKDKDKNTPPSDDSEAKNNSDVKKKRGRPKKNAGGDKSADKKSEASPAKPKSGAKKPRAKSPSPKASQEPKNKLSQGLFAADAPDKPSGEDERTAEQISRNDETSQKRRENIETAEATGQDHPSGQETEAPAGSAGSPSGNGENEQPAVGVPPISGKENYPNLSASSQSGGNQGGGEAPRGNFTAEAADKSTEEAAAIARNTEAAEKANAAAQAQGGAPQPEQSDEQVRQMEAEAEKAAAAIHKQINDESVATKEEAAVTADARRGKILAAMARQFEPGQVLTMPWYRAIPFLTIGALCIILQTMSMNMFQNNLNYLEGYFHASLEETLWLVSAYMAPYASFTILLIKVRTQIGMRRFTVFSLYFFIAICIASLFVHDIKTAIFIRFLAGVTTAPIAAIGFIHNFEVFTPLRKVTFAISINMFFTAIGIPVVRILGPFLLEDGQVYRFYVLEIGIALVLLVLMYFFRIAPLPRLKVLEKLDFLVYFLLATGLGLNAAMMPVGRLYWWMNVNWIGWCFATAIVCVTLALLIDLNRSNPLVNWRWLFSWDMLHITLVMMTFRVLVSDQSLILGNYFATFGLLNDQLPMLYLITIGGAMLGCITACTFLKPGGGDFLYLIAVLIIAAAEFMDSFSTNLTRPEQFYWTQGFIGYGMALFLAVSMSKGMTAAFSKGNIQFVVTFIAAFQFTQSSVAIMGSAFFGTVQMYFEKFHSYIITSHLNMTDPIVAARVAAYGKTYAGHISDKAILNAEGISMLGEKASLEANILGFNDIFRIFGWIAVVLFLLLAFRVVFKAYVTHRMMKRIAAAQQGD